MTDLENIISDFERHRQAQTKLNEGNKGTLFDALAVANIAEVRIEFDGGGDSGQITDIAAFCGVQPASLPVTTVTIQKTSWGSTEIIAVQSSFQEAIEHLCYGYLEETHAGWENNDGAYGEFRFDVTKRSIELEFNGRFTDTWTDNHTF